MCIRDRSYAAPVEIGEVMTGGAVSRVERSLNLKFHEGDLVVGATGWQSHSINDGRSIIPIPSGLPSPSMALGVLGMPGMTAYMGLMDIGQPKEGETLVVAAASGAVGSEMCIRDRPTAPDAAATTSVSPDLGCPMSIRPM